jgi:hypothetical protein
MCEADIMQCTATNGMVQLAHSISAIDTEDDCKVVPERTCSVILRDTCVKNAASSGYINKNNTEQITLRLKVPLKIFCQTLNTVKVFVSADVSGTVNSSAVGPWLWTLSLYLIKTYLSNFFSVALRRNAGHGLLILEVF